MKRQPTPQKCPYCDKTVLRLGEHQRSSKRCQTLRERIKQEGQARIDELKAQGWEEYGYLRVIGFPFDLPEGVVVEVQTPKAALIPGWAMRVGDQLEKVLDAEVARMRRVFLDCVHAGHPTEEAEALITMHVMGGGGE